MTDKKGLTTFQLKVFACLVMVIDHVSAIFMPFYDPMDSSTWPWAFALNNDILRGIGRLALPIFAFLIAEGCRHTRSLPRYCGRLFGFAVLSMVPYCFALFSQNLYTPRLVGDPSWYDEFLGTPPIWFFPDHVGNVLFSLAIGAAAVWLWNKLRPRIRGLVWIVLALYYAASLVIGIAFSVEYAEIIVPLVLGLYLLHRRRAQCLWLAAMMIVYYLGFAAWNGMGLAWVQRLEQLLIRRKHVLSVPLRIRERALRPNYVVVYHHDRSLRRRERVEILIYPVSVAVGDLAEAFGILAQPLEQPVPAEYLDKPRNHRHVYSGHVDLVRMTGAEGVIICVKIANQLLAVLFTVDLVWIERKHLFDVVKRALYVAVHIDAALGVRGVPHARAALGEHLIVYQHRPGEAEIPRFFESHRRTRLGLPVALGRDGDSGHGADKAPVAARRIFGSRDLPRHIQIECVHCVLVGHIIPPWSKSERMKTAPLPCHFLGRNLRNTIPTTTAAIAAIAAITIMSPVFADDTTTF